MQVGFVTIFFYLFLPGILYQNFKRKNTLLPGWNEEP